MLEPGSPPAAGDAPAQAARRRASWALVAAVLAAVALTVGDAVGAARLADGDAALTRFTRAWAGALGWPVELSHALGRATAPGPSTVVAILAVLVLARLRWRGAALLVAVCAIAGVLTAEVTKRAVSRHRPPGAEAYQDDLWRSFPSGHSMSGIYLYLLLGLVLVQLGRTTARPAARAAGWSLVVLGPLIGVSRVILGVHWPTDVLAGWAYGSSVALAGALVLWERVTLRRPRPVASSGRATAEPGEPPAGPRDQPAGPLDRPGA